MVTNEVDGIVSFKVYLPHAESVELVADFTDWQDRRIALEKLGGGWWEKTVPVSTGDHSFSYLVDNRYWMPDYAAHGIRRDDYGNWISALCVAPEAPEPVGVGGPRSPARKDRPEASPGERWSRGSEGWAGRDAFVGQNALGNWEARTPRTARAAG